MATINAWPVFAQQVRACRQNLLRNVAHYPGAVLVSGCQRSGTTMLSRLLMQAPGFIPYRITHDNELDAALVLSGEYPETLPAGRYCFQTTYLNECWPEYTKLDASQRLIWVLRRPDSVVWSMVYHWSPFARQELYVSCGKPIEASCQEVWQRASRWQRWRYRSTWHACMAYIGKTQQLDKISRLLGGRLKVIDYDALVSEPAMHLSALYSWLGVPFDSTAIRQVQSSSLERSHALKTTEKSWVQDVCQPVYQAARDRYLS